MAASNYLASVGSCPKVILDGLLRSQLTRKLGLHHCRYFPHVKAARPGLGAAERGCGQGRRVAPGAAL